MSKTYSFQKYVVAFLDLVGQRDATRRLRSIPTTAAEGREFIELAQESVGTVLELRRHFNELCCDERRSRGPTWFARRVACQAARSLPGCGIHDVGDV